MPTSRTVTDAGLLIVFDCDLFQNLHSNEHSYRSSFYLFSLNSVSKTVKFVAQYAAEQSYCVGMFLYTLFGIFLLPAILTQNIERFDLLGGAGIISKLASGPCFLLR